MRTCRIGDFALLVSRNRIMILGRTCMIRHTGMACLYRFMLSCLKLLHESSWSKYFKFACSDSIISCDKNTNSNWLYTSSSHVSVVCTTGHGQPGQDSCPVDPGIRLWQLAGNKQPSTVLLTGLNIRIQFLAVYAAIPP